MTLKAHKRESTRRQCIATLVFFVAIAATAALPESAIARGLRAKVFVTQAKIPKKLSERQLVRFAKSHRARALRETTKEEVKKRKWRAEMVLSFNQPPREMEFHMLFFDITGGKRHFIEEMTTMIGDRSQKTYLQKLRLKRPSFKPGQRIEVVVTVRRVEVGRVKFDLAGQAEKRSGVVNFNDDET